MAVKIGHASIDEKGKVNSGSAGDQTKKEVCTRTWYNKPWTAVFRAKDSTVAEKIAKAMEQACANDNIGYDQNQRITLYTRAAEAGWNLSKITDKCECDCSSLVAVCVNAAGITVNKGMYTGNEKSLLSATGAFEVLTASKYLGSDTYLKRGDILLGSGHTVIVLSDGSGANQSKSEEEYNVNGASVKVYSKSKNGTQYLAKNFRVKEFACQDGSDPIFISPELVEVLQKIRTHFGMPVNINSGYRTAKHNNAVGGATYSQHLYGTAADITVTGVKPADVAAYAETLLPNTGGIGIYSNFTHVDVRAVKARWNG